MAAVAAQISKKRKVKKRKMDGWMNMYTNLF
jgi:hypothetical protein